jgi:hypothetical protein
MTAEYDASGVFFSAALVSATVAYAVALALRLILVRTNAYRFVWHPALFDLAVFVILWALIACGPWPLGLR